MLSAYLLVLLGEPAPFPIAIVDSSDRVRAVHGAAQVSGPNVGSARVFSVPGALKAFLWSGNDITVLNFRSSDRFNIRVPETARTSIGNGVWSKVGTGVANKLYFVAENSVSGEVCIMSCSTSGKFAVECMLSNVDQRRLKVRLDVDWEPAIAVSADGRYVILSLPDEELVDEGSAQVYFSRGLCFDFKRRTWAWLPTRGTVISCSSSTDYVVVEYQRQRGRKESRGVIARYQGGKRRVLVKEVIMYPNAVPYWASVSNGALFWQSRGRLYWTELRSGKSGPINVPKDIQFRCDPRRLFVP